MNPYDNSQPLRDSVGRGRQRTLPAWMTTPALDSISAISGCTSAPHWSDSNGIARGQQRTLPAWMATSMQASTNPPPPPPYEAYQPWNSRQTLAHLPVVPPPPPPLPTQPSIVHPQQTSLPSFWNLYNEHQNALPASPSHYGIPYSGNLAFTNPLVTSKSGSHERAAAAMFPKGEANYDTKILEDTAPLHVLPSKKGHIDESNIKIHNNDEDSNCLFSYSECESGISTKETFDNFQNTERYSEHPHVPTSSIAAIATRTNSEEGDDMDIKESDTEQELNVASCSGRKSDTLLPNTRVSRRTKWQVLWTRTVQFASSSPDAIPNSIRNPLLELAASTRKEGYLIKLIPEQRRPFIEYCVKTLKVPPKVAEEIFSFIESKRVSEFRWKKALEGYQISLCDDTVVQDIVSRLKGFALRGLLCPRNKVDFFYFCDICFPPISVETCGRVYDYLASHIPEFSAHVVRKPWDGLNSMAEKISMLPYWSNNEKMLFVIEHVAEDDLHVFCPFRSLLLALQRQSKQFSESIFSSRGVGNRKKFIKYCQETFIGVAETDVTKAFRFVSRKIKEYEVQALTVNLVEDDSEVPKKLLLGRIAEIATTADDPPVFIRAIISKLAALSQSNDTDINMMVDLIGFQRMCVKNFDATQAEAKSAYNFFLWQMKKNGESDSTKVEKKALQQPQLKLLLGRIAEIAAAAHDAPVSIKPLLSKLATLTQSKDSSTKTIVDPNTFHSICINNLHATQAEAEEAYNFLIFGETDKAPKMTWKSCSNKTFSAEDDKEAPKPKQAQFTKLLLGRIAEIAATADDAPDSIRELVSKLATIGQENDSSPKTIVDAVRFESMCINNFHATAAEARQAYQFFMSRQKDSNFKALVNHLSLHPPNISSERRLGRQHVENSTISDNVEDDLTTVNHHKIELRGNDTKDCSTNLAPSEQYTGLNQSGLLCQQNDVTLKRDDAFQPSTLALKKGDAFESKYYDEIDTSRHSENMRTDSSCITSIQLKSEMASQVETAWEHNNSDRYAAIQTEKEANSSNMPSLPVQGKVSNVQDRKKEAYNFLIFGETDKAPKMTWKSCSNKTFSAEDDKEAPKPKQAQFTKLLLGRIAEIAATADDAPDSIRELVSKLATIGQENESSPKTIVDAVKFESMCINNFHATAAEARRAHQFLMSRQKNSNFKALVNRSLHPPNISSERRLGRQHVKNSTISDNVEDDLTTVNHHKIELSGNDAKDCSTNLAPSEQYTGINQSGLLCQQNNVTLKRDDAFQPSTLALKNGDAFESKYFDEIDTSRHSENMSTDSSCFTSIQLKSEMASQVETAWEHNSDWCAAIQTEKEANSSNMPSLPVHGKVSTVQDRAKEAYNFLFFGETDKAPKMTWKSCSDKTFSADDKEAPKPKLAHLTKLLLGRIAEIAATADDAPDSIRELVSKLATIGQENDSSPKTIVDAVKFESMCINNFHATAAEARQAYQFFMSRQKDSNFKALVNHLSLHPPNRSSERRLGSNVEDDLTTVNHHKIELSGNDAKECSTNLAPSAQYTGINQSGLLCQQNDVTLKRDDAFQPSTLALKKGDAFEPKYYDEIDTSRHSENMRTDSSCITSIQLKSEMASQVETAWEHNNSDQYAAIQTEKEANSSNSPSLPVQGKVSTVQDKALQMRKLALKTISFVEHEARESHGLKKQSVENAITDDPSQLVLFPDIAARREKLLQSTRAAKEEESSAIREVPQKEVERTLSIACQASQGKLQRNGTNAILANGLRIDSQGDAGTCQNKLNNLGKDITSISDDESKGRHVRCLNENVPNNAARRASVDELITEFFGDSVKYPSLSLASRREGRRADVTSSIPERVGLENVPKSMKSNFVLEASFQGHSGDGFINDLLGKVVTCSAFSEASGQKPSDFFNEDIDNSSHILMLGADIVARREKLRRSVRLAQEKETRLKLAKSDKAVSASEEEARERVLKSLKGKDASRRSSGNGFKTELQYEPKSYQEVKVAAARDQETLEQKDASRILKEKGSIDVSQGSSVDAFATEFMYGSVTNPSIPMASEQEALKCTSELLSFDSSRRSLYEGLKNENDLMVCRSLPKEITALSQRIVISNISQSGPPDLIRTMRWPAQGKLANSEMEIGKVGTTEQSKGRPKRKLSSLAEVEQAGDVQKRGVELHKKLAVLKERLKEKQEKLLLQCDSEMVFAEDQSCTTVSFLPKPSATPLELSMGVVAGKSTDESQNVSNNAELKDSNVSSRFPGISSLRQRQQQLRQTIELNNLKNIASKQKSLLSEQKIRLKESMELLEECSTEVKRYEGLVEDGGKRIADFDRRQRLLLGMLTKATKSVLDARRDFKEAAENLKRSAE